MSEGEFVVRIGEAVVLKTKIGKAHIGLASWRECQPCASTGSSGHSSGHAPADRVCAFRQQRKIRVQLVAAMQTDRSRLAGIAHVGIEHWRIRTLRLRSRFNFFPRIEKSAIASETGAHVHLAGTDPKNAILAAIVAGS